MPAKKRKSIILAVVAAILFALIAWIIWGNTALELSTYTISSSKLPQSFYGYRIAHVSDLHNAEMGKDNETLLTMLRDADPDMIAITGDLIDSRNTDIEVALQFVREAVKIAPCYPNLTASEHMEFLARAYRLTDYKQRVDELFERFELGDKRKKFGDELSKGMQQKLNICLGLLPEPKMLLLDEPMIGLDPHAIKQLKSIIEQMRNEGKTLLVSTHIIDSVDMLWDRTIIMQDGQIRANLTREELERDGRTLEQLFFDVTEGIGRDAMSHTEDSESQGG